MDRQNFIDQFNNYFQKNESKFYQFNIEVKEYDNELEFNENLHQLFIPFFEKLGIKNKYFILNKLPNGKRYDEYYEEDNPDSEFCSFVCKININELYDVVKEMENYHQETIEVYRIETKDNKGLYDSFFGALSVDQTNHPNPREDEKFEGIFDNHSNDYYYMRKWHFGFANIQDIKNWLMTEENQQKLINIGGVIKKVRIDKNNVIEGHKQLIFQMNEKINVEILNWSELNRVKLKL